MELGRIRDARRVAEVHVRARKAAYRDLVAASVLARDTPDRRERQWRQRLADCRVRFYEATGFVVDARAEPAPLGDTGLTRRRFRLAGGKQARAPL